MASLVDSSTMSNDPVLISRVTEAVAQTAYNILATEADDAPNHAEREAFASSVLTQITTYGIHFTRMCVANPTIAAKAPDQADVPDGDILYVVDQLWIGFAAGSPLNMVTMQSPPAPEPQPEP